MKLFTILKWFFIGYVVYKMVNYFDVIESYYSTTDVPTQFGPHLPPFSQRALLLPTPRYEVSLSPDHSLFGTISGNDQVYQHLNEPNLISYAWDAKTGCQYPPSNTRLSLISPQTTCVNIKNTIPKNNRFYVKNRVGNIMYSENAVEIPTDGSVKRVGIKYYPSHKLIA